VCGVVRATDVLCPMIRVASVVELIRDKYS
jgi:hypothetical protein